MKQFDGLQSLQQPLSGLPQWVSERILQQINQLTHYEPVIGIMGKTGAGKSSLCNALFAGDISPVSDVAACTRKPLQFRLQLGKRFMTIMDLPGVGDRASITGKFSEAECLKLDVAFPHFISQMESMLTTGEMNPRHAHCVTLYHNGFTCEADTLGSCGYVYIAIYPTQR
ncbi:TPA_asm: hypothetical protein G4Y12_001830 [Salmonella enterica subsp. enterica serovar Sandiego]|nr:hypothetical protein [Salmonella enterica]EBU6929716.1 hypothetical protein [Salmonella enterica subsp. enterica serovar Sandiego]EBB1687171.1 hypothetical protein [Salmonella enterica]EBL2579607.1 hypothetical protein [Salmonella enterica]EGN5852998.1 hypothetical protein [Salmonella enterica]